MGRYVSRSVEQRMQHWHSKKQIMTDETVTIDNLPDVNDINVCWKQSV